MSNSSDEDSYRLTRDSASSGRLNAQHYFWKQVCGFNLHPRILASANEDMKIADVATGTCIWLIDVKLGTTFRVDGFDKSLEQCPPAELLPEGCSIRQLDILDKLPEDLENVYDVVHVRLIQGGLKEDPVPVLKNLIAMLKPGGYLQWQEVNLIALTIASAKAGLDQSNTEELLNAMQRWVGKWTNRLAEICTENGLLEAKTYRYCARPELAVPFGQTQLGAYEEISKGSMDNSSPDSEGPRFRALVERVHVELKTGVWLDHKVEVTVAQKAC